MALNRGSIYWDDLYGYDDLYRFGDLFPTYDMFVKKINAYMFVHELNREDEMMLKLYNILYNKYKNNFFRWSKQSSIFNEMALRLESVIQAYNVAIEVEERLEELTGTNVTTQNYKTNNTSEETDISNNTKYRTNIETEKTDNGLEYLDRRKNSIQVVHAVQNFVKECKTMFMNRTDENIYKEIYTK